MQMPLEAGLFSTLSNNQRDTNTTELIKKILWRSVSLRVYGHQYALGAQVVFRALTCKVRLVLFSPRIQPFECSGHRSSSLPLFIWSSPNRRWGLRAPFSSIHREASVVLAKLLLGTSATSARKPPPPPCPLQPQTLHSRFHDGKAPTRWPSLCRDTVTDPDTAFTRHEHEELQGLISA